MYITNMCLNTAKHAEAYKIGSFCAEMAQKMSVYIGVFIQPRLNVHASTRLSLNAQP